MYMGIECTWEISIMNVGDSAIPQPESNLCVTKICDFFIFIFIFLREIHLMVCSIVKLSFDNVEELLLNRQLL